MRFSRIGVEIVAQPDICGEAAVHSHEVLGKTRRESFAVSAVGIGVGGIDPHVRQGHAFKEELEAGLSLDAGNPNGVRSWKSIKSVNAKIQRPIQIEPSELRAEFQGVAANGTRKLVLNLINGRKIA